MCGHTVHASTQLLQQTRTTTLCSFVLITRQMLTSSLIWVFAPSAGKKCDFTEFDLVIDLIFKRLDMWWRLRRHRRERKHLKKRLKRHYV